MTLAKIANPCRTSTLSTQAIVRDRREVAEVG